MVGFCLIGENDAIVALQDVETIRAVKNGHIHDKQPDAEGNITIIQKLFGIAVWSPFNQKILAT